MLSMDVQMDNSRNRARINADWAKSMFTRISEQDLKQNRPNTKTLEVMAGIIAHGGWAKRSALGGYCRRQGPDDVAQTLSIAACMCDVTMTTNVDDSEVQLGVCGKYKGQKTVASSLR